jgi:hypothetical protein
VSGPQICHDFPFSLTISKQQQHFLMSKFSYEQTSLLMGPTPLMKKNKSHNLTLHCIPSFSTRNKVCELLLSLSLSSATPTTNIETTKFLSQIFKITYFLLREFYMQSTFCIHMRLRYMMN